MNGHSEKKQGTYVLEVSSESIYFRFTMHRCTPAGGPGGENMKKYQTVGLRVACVF